MAKFCSQCGAQLEDAMVFCSQCGAKQEGAAPVQETVQPEYTAPVYTAQQAVAYANPVVPKAVNKNMTKKIVLFIAILLQIAAVLIFSLAEVVDSEINMTGEVSQNGYSQSMNETDSNTGKVFDICDPEGSDEAEQFEAYGLDLDGFKTLKIVAIAIVAVSGVGVLALAIGALMNSNKSTAFGAVGVISQLAFAGGSILWVFVLLKNQLEDFMGDSMRIMSGSYQQYGVSVDMSVSVSNTFTALGWVAIGLAVAALVATAAAMVGGKADKKIAPVMPVTY